MRNEPAPQHAAGAPFDPHLESSMATASHPAILFTQELPVVSAEQPAESLWKRGL